MLKTVTNSINASQIQTPITLPGNVTLSTGNLVIGTSGKGIDFSATPGTGTSELFADYEEGTWTPTQGLGLTVVGTFSSSAFYTKVGRLVQVTGVISATTSLAITAGSILCGGLPFASNSSRGSAGSLSNASINIGGTVYTSINNIYATTSVSATTDILFTAVYFV